MQQQNPQFEMAVQFVNQTARHLFLTGKAGTGKTTFLKSIKENSPKKLAVVAPTGVAAMNAGGVTIHSFFQLPFGSFLPGPGEPPETSTGNFFTRQSLLRQLKLNTAKRELMRELDLLILDEVSMLRADLLDAIDTVLRHVRRQENQPFGGIQMVFIGDLFQLPPVVKEEEWSILRPFYASPFFFHAQALQQTPPLYLELKKIYRQSDQAFIDLLNKLRNNQVQTEDLQLLQQFYKPDFTPETKGEYIILTTHNAKADVINQGELRKLPGKSYTFTAETEGDFNEKAVPAEKKLQLKEGAQIMFIRNDKGEERRYFNGKTGTVKKIKAGEIWVSFPGEEDDLLVEKESWKNVRYKYNAEADEVEEIVKGTFTQFPLRLAWAITIHKSQGLTFHKAIIDAGDSFAPGQVYVALSRLSSLQGLVLHSPIIAENIRTEVQATAIGKNALNESSLQQELQKAQQAYIHQLLIEAFNWHKLTAIFGKWKESLDNRRIPLLEEAKVLAPALQQQLFNQQKVAEKFIRQLEQLLPSAVEDGYRQLHQRMEAAVTYFGNALSQEVLQPLEQHLEQLKQQSKKAKKYQKDVESLSATLKIKRRQLEQLVPVTGGLMSGTDPQELLQQIETNRKKAVREEKQTAKKQAKPAKGETRLISLQLFKEGKSVEEIAASRGMVPGTIEGHLAHFITTGELALSELVSKEKSKAICSLIEQAEEELSASALKAMLSEEVSYGEIRAVQNHLKRQAEQIS